MELECDLSKINNEELLRKMWQQSEDICRKKEIRTQLYKLRESRLRDLYQGDIMADNTVAGFGKDPLATSHGDALADQSFQSLKSKEIRDSLSPTEMKFQSMALNNPNNTGWNVQSSKEVTPDGRGFRAETLATTDGVEHINGGTAEFKGRNEQRSSAHHEGDDKNFVKKAMESSNSHLQEKVVIGDENSGRTEVRTSSSKSTSSSQVFQSSSNVEYEDGHPIQSNQPQKYLMDSSPNRHYQPHEVQQRQLHEEQRLREEQRLYEQQFQQQRRTTEQMSSTQQRQNTEQKNVTQNVQTQETHEQNKRYVDMDKASPEYQQHVQHLMQQPGEIISNTVEYPKPNVKMITTVKRLPDGTIVRNKRYETEEVAPSGGPSNRPTSSAPNQTQIRRDSQQPQPGKYYQPDVAAAHSPQRPNEDMVDSATTTRYVHDTHNDDVETKVTSSVKKSSRKFSTETTSETIQEYDDRYPQGGEPSPRSRPQQTNDFSTHGFPSVRPNKPTQEYASERPRPSPHYNNQAAPKPNEAVVPPPQHYTDAVDNVNERRITTDDGGEIIIVSSEKKRNYKTQTNSERVVETEHIVKDDQQDFTTQGFPSVREPLHHHQQPKMHPSERQIQPHEQDFPLDKLPAGTRITRPSGTDDNVVVSSQKLHTSKYNTNTERVIEHEIIRDDQGYPRMPQLSDNMPYTVTTPGDQQPPHGEFPGSPRKPGNVDYSTHGFPSVRTPTKGDRTPQGEYHPGSTQGFPSKPAAGYPSSPQQQEYPGSPRKAPNQGYSTQGFPSVRTPAQGHPSNGAAEPNRTAPTSKTQQPRTPSPNKYNKAPTTTTTTRETTERVIRKEKEVDSAHRAFAASLRSSPSPIEPMRRDSHTTDSHARHTPRSSVSSVKTYRRDMREGSHDSAPSETSRISTTTVTRNTPPRTVGGRTVVTRVVTTKTGLGSNDSLTKTTPRGSTKSPSPGKSVTSSTTTTTTTTRTGGKAPTPSRDVPKSTSTDKQHTRIPTTTINSSITINATTPQTTKPQPQPQPLTTTALTKIQISDNHKLPPSKYLKKSKSASKRNSAPIFITPNDANVEVEVKEIIEKPCIKRNYYKLGQSETPSSSLTIQEKQENAASKPYKLSQTNDKSPVKKPSRSPSHPQPQPQPQPSAPNRSRSSTPSYNNRKPIPTTTTTPTTKLVDNDDYVDDNDDEVYAPSSLSPSSFSSRKPQQTIASPKTPQDDWQTPRNKSAVTATDDDERRRTVQRETTFEKNENDSRPLDETEKPRKPSYQPQPNVEWIIVDDVDIEDHDHDHDDLDDDDDFTTEVVDSRDQLKKTTRNLIVNEKRTPLSPLKGQKAPLPNIADKTRKPVVTSKPNDKVPHPGRPQKSLPDSRSPLHTPTKSQPKAGDSKPTTKSSPKPSLPSYTSPLRRPVGKVPSDVPSTPKRTVKTTSQVIKDTTTRLIADNRMSGRPTKPTQAHPQSQTQSPVRRPNKTPQSSTPLAKYPEPGTEDDNTTTIIETTETIKRTRPQSPYETPESQVQERPYNKPVDAEPNKPREGMPYVEEPHYPTPLHGTTETQFINIETSEYRLPERDDSPQKPYTPGYNEPETSEPNDFTPGYDKPQSRKPIDTYREPKEPSSGNKKPRSEPFVTDVDESITEDETLVTSTRRTVAKHIQKFETNALSDTKPKPLKGPKSPPKPLQKPTNQRRPEEPLGRRPQSPTKQVSPTRAPQKPKEPETFDQEHQHHPQQLRPSKPRYTEDGEEIVEEFVEETTTRVEKSFHPEKKFPKDSRFPDQKYPNEPSGRRSQSPEKHTPKDSKTPVRSQEVPSGRRPQSPEKHAPKDSKSPVRGQEKPGQKYPEEPSGRRPQSPEKHAPKDSKTPIRTQEKPGQKSPEVPSRRRPQSPSKPLSPTRMPKKPADIETSRTNVNTKKLFFEEYPTKTGPKGRKPLDSEDDETVTVESTVISSTKKLITTEQEIQEIEKLQYPKEPYGKRPHSPNRFGDSPLRSPVKEQPAQKSPQLPTKPGKPEQTKPRESAPLLDTDEEETFVETSEFVITTRKDKLIKPDDKTTTPVRDLPKPICRFPREPSRQRPQSPNQAVSPTRTTKKPEDDRSPQYPKEFKPKGVRPYDDETTVTETQQFVINNTTKLITTEQEIRDNKFPTDSKSPQRLHEKPEPSGRRPQSPTKPSSPNRFPMKPEEKKPKGVKPFDTDDEQTVVETSEFVINTTKKLITTEQDVQETDKSYHPGRKQPKDSKSPEPVDKHPGKPSGKRPQSPDKHVSPTRTPKQPVQPEQIFETTKTTKVVTEKTTQVMQEFEYPEETQPFDQPSGRYPSPSRLQKKPEETRPVVGRPQSPNKHVSPSRSPKEPQPSVNDQTFRKTLRTDKVTQPKPKGQKPSGKKPTDTDSEEEETFTETSETVIKSTQKRIVTPEEETLEYEQPKYPGDKPESPLREQPKYPGDKPGSPLREQPKYPGDKPGSPLREQPKYPGDKPGSPIREQPKHPGDKPGTTPLREHPKYPGDKPGTTPLREHPKQRKPLDTEDDDTCVVTSEFIISTTQKQTVTETDEPVRADSPTRSQRKPQEPQKPKHVSPVRSSKLPVDDETFKTSLRSQKITTEKTTKKFTDDKPRDGFPDSDRPTDDADEEEYPKKPRDFIKDTTQKLIVSEQQIPDIEKKPKKGLKEPLVPERYVTETVTITTTEKLDKDDYPEATITGQNYYKPRDISPSTILKIREGSLSPDKPGKPDEISPLKGQKKPERSPSPSKPKSPTRAHKKPEEKLPVDDEIYTSSLKTSTKTVREKHITTIGIEEHPEEGDKPRRTSPSRTQKKPERSPSPSKPGSPTRTHKKPAEKQPVDDETYATSVKTTKTVREKVIRTIDGEEYPEEYPDGDKPRRTSPSRTQKKPERSPSPSKPGSPTRTPKKPEEKLPVDDETYTSSVKTTKTVREKHITTIGIEEYPEEGDKPRRTSPSRTQEKPERSPSPNKPGSPTRTHKKPEEKLPVDDETYTSSVKTTKTVREKVIRTIDDEEYPEEYPDGDKPRRTSPSRTQKKPERSPSPNKPGSPTRTHRKPEEKLPVDDETYTSSVKTTKTVRTTTTFDGQEYPEGYIPRDISPSRTPKEPERPLSPSKTGSPTRIQKKPAEKQPLDDETYTSSVTSTKTIREKITKTVDDEHYPEGDKPRDISPLTDQKTKPERTPSPTKPNSPTRTHKKPAEKVPLDSETCKTTLKTTKTVKEQIITTLDNEEYPEGYTPRDTSPSRPQKKSERTPSPSKPGSPTRQHKTPQCSSKVEPFPIDEDDNPAKPSYLSSPKSKPKYNKPGDSAVNTSQRLLTSEREVIETDRKVLKGPKDSKQKPNKESSPTRSPHRPTTLEDETFKKTLRTTEIITGKKPKDRKPKGNEPRDTDEDETTSETEELVVETCQKSYIISEKPDVLKPTEKKPEDKEPESDTDKPEKPWKAPLAEFIVTERKEETPDGAFISKTTEPTSPTSPTSPTYKKKGAGRRDTFEERCRQILGMDNYGDTPGNYKQKPMPEVEEEPKKPDVTKPVMTEKQDTTVFQVRIEDCDEDDEPLSINSVKKTLHKQIHTNEPLVQEPKDSEPEFKPKGENKKKTPESEDDELVQITTKTTTVEKNSPKEPEKKPKGKHPKEPECEENEKEHGYTVTKTTTIHKKSSENKPDEPKETSFEPKQQPKGQPKSKHPQEPEFGDDENEFGYLVTKTTTVHKKSGETKPKEPDFEPTKTPKGQPKVKQPQEPEFEDDENEFGYLVTKTTTVHKKSGETKPQEPDFEPIKAPKGQPKGKQPQESENEESNVVHKVTKTTSVQKKTGPTDDIEDLSEPEVCISSKHVDKTLEKQYEVKITSKTSPTSTPRSGSPTKGTTTSKTSTTPLKGVSPTKDMPKRKPSKDNIEPKTSGRKSSTKDETSTTSIKERLRSSTRKTKSPQKHDQIDGSDDSSPDHSPNRLNERRRSSNISVNTEIIIEHTDSETKNAKKDVKRPQDSVYRDIIDSTVMPEKLTRRMPVTERKESAPVQRVTAKDKDSKMSRSTSENLIKVKKPEAHNVPKGSPKPAEHRSRPTKCFATKTINLSPRERLTETEIMDNVIIDIQHAKSSREPSPDKIVPTPVPAHLDTGKPRYPDNVQEPEDDMPRRQPVVKNIPIFEEEHNAYVGCHITEINVERTDTLDYNKQIIQNPIVEAPPSLDYMTTEKTNDDEETVLTVNEKLMKFQNIAEEQTKPKTSEPFHRILDVVTTLSEDDECLLTVDEKRERFLKTSEHKKPEKTAVNIEQEHMDDEDYKEFVRNERIYAAKLAPMTPQKSPELVRTISRNISRHSDHEQQQAQQRPEATEDYNPTPLHTREDFVECYENNSKKSTKEFEVSHHHHHQTQMHTHTQSEKQTNVTDNNKDGNDRQAEYLNTGETSDDEELIPLSSKHTTIIEKRRQKDILSRPSVFEGRNKPTTAAATATTTTPSSTSSTLKCNKSPVKDSQKLRTQPNNTKTTKTTVETNKPNTQQSSPSSRKNTDIDYEVLSVGNNNNNIITKQTKNYKESSVGVNSDVGSNKTNDLKKPYNSSNHTKPKQNMPVCYRPAQNTHGDEFDADEIIVNTTHTTATTAQHSSTNSSLPLQPSKFPIATKEHYHVETLTNTNESLSTSRPDVRPDLDEIVLEPSNSNRKPKTKMSTATTTTTMDSVAARRTLFENNSSSGQSTPTKRTPAASPMSGRRPSYMDHTKSSLEHTRRDSLEVNKSHYSRKPSHPEEDITTTDRNSTVKFDMPQGGKRPSVQRPASTNEDIDVEEIFDLEILEKLLETVQSYEIRRRIRAQIRLIKKNQKNELISQTEVVTTKVSPSKGAKPTTSATSTEETVVDTTAVSKKETKQTSSKKEYIFEETYLPTSRKTPQSKRYGHETEPTDKKSTRQPSPDPLKEQVSSTTTTSQKQYYYQDDYQQEEFREITHESSPTRQSPTRKPKSLQSSPDRHHTSPESKSPVRDHERSRSPQSKPLRKTTSHSPDSKTSPSRRKSSTTSSTTVTTSTTSKPLTKRITTTTTTTTSTPNNGADNNRTPLWADRKNILKTPGSATPKKPTATPSTVVDTRSGYSKSVNSKTSQKQITQKSSFVDDDCITSSYGIGPTDENGLPLFGIRALKKKKPQVEPSETTEEVTGYVVEEKYYSDSKTKPTVERKEFIYSTNPDELEKLKEQIEVTSSTIKALKDVDVKETRKAALISKSGVKGAPPTAALRSSPEDDFLDTTTKYVRRGSVKEMSEKFIQKEASSSTVTEKTNNYPKAGLILRTNSRKNSRDNDNETDNYETYKTTRIQHHSTVLGDSDGGDGAGDGGEHEYEVEEVASRHSGRFVTESESECDSIKTQREFKKVTSSSSSSMATRSFLNSQGEERVITNVSDCLERMRNADNVVEAGDSAEDQEARALLNKFLGASIIMKGVESSMPAAAAASSNRQSKIITTTTTSSNLSDDYNDDNTAKHEIKTTRITKTIKSGDSSTPVTCTTCDIEEIWDEEILKELLEQAKTYEERRKIRSRLRELMADREATKQSPSGSSDKDTVAAAPAVNVQAEEESSASEYEEIIEEVTDYSEAESEVKAEINVKTEKAPIKEACKKEEEKSASSSIASTTTETTTSSAVVEQSKKEEVVSETETKSQVKIVSETITETQIVEEEQEQEHESNKDVQGESLNAQVVHDTDKPTATQNMLKEAANPINDKKLKSAQTILNSKVTCSSENSSSSSMQAPFNSKVHKTTTSVNSSSSSTSQNPIVTVQTAARTDSNVMHKNSNSNSNNNNSKRSSSSLGGNSVVVDNDSPRQVDRLSVPQKEDSGTESGEDLRLIAAGLRDQLQIQSDANIIEDVTGALGRLENSLKEGKDITVDSEKRKALLALVERLRAGLTSPEKLAEIAAAMSSLDGGEGLYGESSSPEADAHRSNRSRFAKRRNRVSRHTVGVSREELADARRYMEDMLIMGNKSQSTTPDANSINNNIPPQWYPIEKNASMSAIRNDEASAPILQRPKQFVSQDNSQNNKLPTPTNNNKRRPLSGEYSVTFEPTVEYKQETAKAKTPPKERTKQNSSPDDSSRNARFSNKKHLMKRANTIDLAKTHKYNSEFDTDSDAEDKHAALNTAGLKRAVQVSVKKRVQNVVPPFEPKTENDRKFLAFINKQSDKPGLGWTSSRSVSNWTNKFGSIKSTFEGGLKGKPPQVPHHNAATKSNTQVHKLYQQQPTLATISNRNPQHNYVSNQQIAQRLQQEAQRQAEERRRHLERERERLEYERREREKLERQRQQREMQERERLEREHFERQRREQDQITAKQHAAILREQQQIAAAAASQTQNVPKPLPINEFKHAPQSVFRPIDSVDAPVKPIYKPIPQLARQNANSWQSVNPATTRAQGSSSLNASPSQYGNARPDASFITSPPPSARSPIGLPWASKPTVDNSSFKTKAHRFEEASKYDNVQSAGPYIQRHNSLRSSNGTSNHISDDFRKRPSLPNTFDPYSINQMAAQQQDPLAYLPPPQNISFTYSNPKSKVNYQSYPCLPLAVSDNAAEKEYQSRPRESSLTDPHAVPLVLTSTNPSYCPATASVSPQLQHQQLNQSRGPPPRQFDLVSPADSLPNSPSVYNTLAQTDYTDDDLDSDNNLLEYHAVSRVMGNPQTAVTVGRRTGHVSDDELYGKNSRAAKNLLSTIKSMGNKNGGNGNGKAKQSAIKRAEKVTTPQQCLSPDGRSYQAPLVEPLFPEINKFESNRKPVYLEQEQLHTNKPARVPQAAAPAPRKQMSMYKSMESLNRNVNMGPYKQQPSPKPYVSNNFEQQPLSFPSNQTNYPASQQQPYVSETQTSYVVTYPVEDTTDDEEFTRHSSRKMPPPQTLDLGRQRKVSEASTTSSNTATSISYSQNLPSPNTSWTANPIVMDESTSSSSYQPPRQQTAHKNVAAPQNYAEPTYQALSSAQVNRNYATLNQPPPQQAPQAEQKSIPSTKTSYEAQTQRQLQQQISQNAYEKQQQLQSQTEQRTQLQQQTQIQPQSHRTPKPITTQKLSLPASNQQQTSKTSKQTSSTISQEKRSLIGMRKTLSEDQSHAPNIMRDQTILNPQNSNISQEMLDRLEQQRERISNEAIRRKSLGNALDYQMEKQARYDSQQQQQQPQQEYKSSAPADTPDIVKSSLPKDENQPILKKFGPPQRHHYMPNSYQSPSVNSMTSTSTSTTTRTMAATSSAATHTTVLKTKQQQQQVMVANNTRPTVMETPATPQPDDDYIPRNIVYNNVHAFSSMSRRQDDESMIASQEQHHHHHHSTQLRPNKLSKSDSWNQIVMLQNQNNQMHNMAATNKHNASPTNELRRTKSGHTLALPKMYEAAMTKTDITEKQKTVQAYFAGQKSPIQQEMLVEQQQQLQQQLTSSTKRSVINRTKTSEKVSAASRKSLGSNLPIVQGGLTRSATMPHIANLNLLDESNVEDAFEQLIMEQKQQQKLSSSTTEKTETKEKDGAVVTTTTKVTTRTVTGSAAKQPVSPFNKFKQLDSQQQSAKSPTTTTTTPTTASPTTASGGNQPIFKFTDPALNARAATVKDQLLQWCQSKTQEYENVQITNFSTSWNNGLAFCALIHHFLPDAFDYSQLTPKNRRKNFELAFTVADEKAGIAPLLDVEDMVVMQRPDWKCVFVYVQSIYRRFRNCQ